MIIYYSDNILNLLVSVEYVVRLILSVSFHFLFLKIWPLGTSLVVQGLGPCTPLQGTGGLIPGLEIRIPCALQRGPKKKKKCKKKIWLLETYNNRCGMHCISIGQSYSRVKQESGILGESLIEFTG